MFVSRIAGLYVELQASVAATDLRKGPEERPRRGKRMVHVDIHAAEYPIRKVFSDDFVFSVPRYQRPYAWTVEQAGELLEDLLASVEDKEKELEGTNPYFLGSIVLIKADAPEAEIVDGQQRLATLTILLAALRSKVQPGYSGDLTPFLYEKGSAIVGTPNRYRLTLRERDAQFFRTHIQDEGGIQKLESTTFPKLSDSQENIRRNALLFLQSLEEYSEEQRLRLAQFIINRCLLVLVSTPDFDSAYRIFSVLNDRGLNLSYTDILKSEIVGEVHQDLQEQYAEKWEDTEEALGREAFADLFAHIRMIYRKAKLRDTILKETRQYVRPNDHPVRFVNETLLPFSEAFEDIRNGTYQDGQQTHPLNSLFGWLNRIDNFDWVPPAILYLSRNRADPQGLVRFFTHLERLAAALMVRRANINERIERYSRVLAVIEDKEDLYSTSSPLQVTPEERSQVLSTLNGDLYLMEKIRLYVLLRLDSALSQGEASYKFPIVTVEHVLPQEPAVDSMWTKWFPNEETRARYVHQLGNLVLLSRSKNSQARNFDFSLKKHKYFTNSQGVSPFALTTQVLNEEEWKPKVIQRRQKQLISVLKKVWDL